MKTLVAGIGNLFLGDDAFGIEVIRRLAVATLPGETVVKDFGVGGIHLAYDLLEPFDLLVLIDLAPRGGAAGTLYVLDPELDGCCSGPADAHGMDLPGVFATVRQLGGAMPRVRIVGCEPGQLDERIGLSEPVAAAVERAVLLVRELLEREHEQSPSQSRRNAHV